MKLVNHLKIIKTYDARIDGKKTVRFGDSKYQDFTAHKDHDRKQRYIDRHRKNESWGKDGVDTAGFYSKHILWNKPTIQASVADLNNKDKKYYIQNEMLFI